MHTVIIGGTRGIGRILGTRVKGFTSVIGRTPPTDLPFPTPRWYPADLLDHNRLIEALNTAHAHMPITGLVLAQRYRGDDADAWDHEFETMVTASKVVIDWAASHLCAGGAIVAITSPASSRVVTEQGAAYHVAKAALSALVRYYAVTLAPKQIRLNAIAPSATLQERNRAYYDAHPEYGAAVPLGRLGTPEDVADTVSFLLSDAARFITGQEFTVDGGAALLHPHSLVRHAVEVDGVSRPPCRLCSAVNTAPVLRLPSTPPGDHFVPTPDVVQPCYALQVMLCPSCGLAQLDTVVPPAEIYSRYLYTTQSSPGLSTYFAEAAERIRAVVALTPASLVVDIGSNDGTLLKAFQPYARVVGVDPAERIAAAADASGVPTVAAWWTLATAETIRRTHGPATLITATNVMANVEDLHAWMTAVCVALADDGVLVIETGYWPDLVEKLLLETVEHEHLSYFSIRALRSLAAYHDLALVRVEHTESKGGSIRAFFQRTAVPRTIWGADDNALMGREVALATDDFQSRADAICTRVHDLVALSILQGRSVTAYGASVGGSTLLYACRLNALVDGVLDDNPARHGLFTPGAHLPVRPSSAIAQADDVVVLAWRYFDRIRAAHPDFRGRWIVPLPDPSVQTQMASVA